ncbi:hypothetical protein B0H11DRAFT_1933521 [Mycena galericulata]|nr:hypothetical protein B0H11DRAFT_1933521 [Mycena galericulata]
MDLGAEPNWALSIQPLSKSHFCEELCLFKGKCLEVVRTKYEEKRFGFASHDVIKWSNLVYNYKSLVLEVVRTKYEEKRFGFASHDVIKWSNLVYNCKQKSKSNIVSNPYILLITAV